MEKRKVSVWIGGQQCSFYSDDSDDYIEELVQRANEAFRQAYGSSTKAILLLTDALMREEKKKVVEEPAEIKNNLKTKEQPKRSPKKNTDRAEKDNGQISVWDLIRNREV